MGKADGGGRASQFYTVTGDIGFEIILSVTDREGESQSLNQFAIVIT